jgi:PilZ domain
VKEQPRSDRRRTYLAGRIVFNGRSSTMDCLIRNLSRNGAMLEFYEPVIPRHEVDLFILSRGVSLRARVVWCNGVRAGVSIEQPDSGAVVSIETARLIRRLKTDHEALAKRVAELREPV